LDSSGKKREALRVSKVYLTPVRSIYLLSAAWFTLAPAAPVGVRVVRDILEA